MSKNWKRELVLLAGLLQKELGRLPRARVKHTSPIRHGHITDIFSVRSQVCPQIWLYVPGILLSELQLTATQQPLFSTLSRTTPTPDR